MADADRRVPTTADVERCPKCGAKNGLDCRPIKGSPGWWRCVLCGNQWNAGVPNLGRLGPVNPEPLPWPEGTRGEAGR